MRRPRDGTQAASGTSRIQRRVRTRVARLCVVVIAVLIAAEATALTSESQRAVRVGGKAFTEQEILVEIVAQLLERDGGVRERGVQVRRRGGLGGTDICHAALVRGELDLYVEYTGTALVNVLGLPPMSDPDHAFRRVAEEYRDKFDVEWLPPIGFDNTYAIAVRRGSAEELALSRVSDLRAHAPRLVGGFTAEFAERPDGLPALHAALGARLARSVDLDPGLMYDALLGEQVDVIAAFATDPRLDFERMVILVDDLALFPPYRAAPVVRAETLARHPQIRDALAALAGTIDDSTMRRLNAEVDLAGRSARDVAREWIDARRPSRNSIHSSAGSLGDSAGGDPLTEATPRRMTGLLALAIERRNQLARRIVEHLMLVFVGLVAAIAIGIPFGVWAERTPSLRMLMLGGVEVVQTIPSLAMLAFLFALFGVLGFLPAVVALILYALLPVVVNTAAGLAGVPAPVLLAADAMGMSRRQRLWRVELPIAAPIILAGIRTAAILTVGIATLSTYIGAGGLGDFIARGLARNDPRLTLLGAVPAALMAIMIGAVLRALEMAAARHAGNGSASRRERVPADSAPAGA